MEACPIVLSVNKELRLSDMGVKLVEDVSPCTAVMSCLEPLEYLSCVPFLFVFFQLGPKQKPQKMVTDFLKLRT